MPRHTLLALLALAAAPTLGQAQGPGRALVYCPVALDAVGCDNIVAALDAAASPFAGLVDRGYDGGGGTIDLATADLSTYRVLVVPSLADDPSGQPYALLRSSAVAPRLRAILTGRRAVWSGTPDLGSANPAEKSALLVRLATWGAGGSGPGLVALLDNSEPAASRYDWLVGLGALTVAADTTLVSWGAVQSLSATGSALVAPGGQSLAYPNMAAFGLTAGTGGTSDARGLAADGSPGATVLVTADATATAPPSAPPPGGSGVQRALVYCPVGIDIQGCDNLVVTLGGAGTPFGGADRAYDGSGGTLDLRTMDLAGYAVMLIPSLSDGVTGQPYALLRDPTVAARLKAMLLGPVAIWTGTPDLGSVNATLKGTLVLNLARWAAAAHTASGLEGLVVLQDASEDPLQRYGWLGGITHVRVAGDTVTNAHDNAQVLTTLAVQLLDDGSGMQLGYPAMAGWGLVLPPGSGLGADATGGRTAQIVLASTGSAGGGNGVLATVTTDRQDYVPGDTVTISGTGWQPSESVRLLLHEMPQVHPDSALAAVADAQGRILNRQFIPDQHSLNVRFVLTATGVTSGRVAQATFTDGTVGSAPVTIKDGACAVSTTSFGFGAPVCASVALTVQGGGTADFRVEWDAPGAPVIRATDFANRNTGTFTDVLPAAVRAGTWTVRSCKGTGANACNGNNTADTKTFTVAKGGTTTALARTAGGATSVFGESLTFTATVTAPAGTVSGSVDFKDGATTLATVALTGCTATCTATLTTATLAVGGHTLQAVYAGDANLNGSSSGTLSQQVGQASTTTALASSANPSVVGQSVTFTATVAAVAPSTGAQLTGPVTFKDGATALGSATVSGGQATFSTSALGLGAHSITASYGGSTGYGASASATLAQAVNPIATTVAVGHTPTTSVFGQAVTFTATVAAVAPGGGTPTGSVTFVEGGSCAAPGVVISGAQTLSGGQASALAASLSVATHTVFACYGGSVDGSYAASFGAATHTVAQASTATALSSSLNPSALSQSVTLTATVTVASPGAGTPTGTVTFKDGATTLGTGTLSTTPPYVATLATSSLAVGPHPLTAVYGGDASFAGSTSPSLSQSVTAAATTTTVASSLNPSTFGQNVTFTASVTSLAGTVNTGSVTFYAGGTCAAPGPQLKAATAVSATGQATLTTATLPGGTTVVLACYGGGSFAPSGGQVTQTVSAAATLLTAAPATGTYLGGAALSATLTAGGSPVSGKTIDFTLNGVAAGSATTNASGVATIASASLGTIDAGAYPAGAGSGVRADFAGDASVATATAGSTLTVTRQTPTLVAQVNGAASGSATYGGTVQLTGKLDPQSGPMLSGRTLTFDIGGTAVGSGTTNSSGNVTLTVNLSAFPALVASATPYVVTVSFAGETNYAARNATASLTISKTAATLAFGPLAFTYDGTPKPVTVTTTPAGLTGVSVTYAGSPTPPTNTGSYAVVASLSNPSYAAPDITGTLVISPASQTITFAALPDRAFGDAPFTVSATASSGLAVVFSAGATDACTVAGSTVTLTSAGSCTITASQPGNGNVAAAAPVPRTFAIAKATPVIVWADPAAIAYGTALGAAQLNATATGVGQVPLAGTFTYTPAAGTLLSAGNGQSLAVLFTPTNSADYATATKSVTIDVLKATPVATVTGTTATYDKSPHGASAYAVTGVNGAVLTASATLSYVGTGSTQYGPASAAPVNAGTYAVTVSFPGDQNYAPASASDAIVIDRATPTIVWAAPAAITYGTALGAAQLDAHATGIGGEAVSGTFIYTPAGGTVPHAGSHTLSTDFASSDPNYTGVAGTTVTLLVNPATLTATAQDKSRTYGAASPPFPATYAGFVNGDGPSLVTGTPNLTTTALATSGVASNPYPITWGTPIGVSAGPDYVIVTANGSLTVTPAPLAVSADGKTRLYGSATPPFTAAISGYVNGETLATSGVTGAAAFTGPGTTITTTTGVGSYAITPLIGSLQAVNYAFTTFTDGALVIEPAPLTVTADAKTREYGDPGPAFTATLAGFVNGETAATAGVSGTAGFSGAGPASNTGTNVGSYAITPSAGTLAAPNYTFDPARGAQYVDGALIITKAPLVVKANDASKIYGDVVPAFSGTLLTVKNNDPITANWIAGAGGTFTATTNAGIYAGLIKGLLNDPSARLGNYDLTYVPGTLTILQATPVFSTLSSPSVIFGTTSTTVGGTLAYAGTGATVYPSGGGVAVTFNGSTLNVPVGASGAFTATFPTAAVDVLGNPYPITYHFRNDETPDNFTAATDGTGALTIVDQTAPLASNVSASPNPVPQGSATTLSAQLSDASRGSSTIQSAQVTVDNGVTTQTLPLTLGAGTVTRTGTASLNLPTGVYSLCVTGTDAAGNTSAVECTLLAVYDASDGFVTGGGWITSPAGAYVANPALTGKANFGFVSKYQKGASVPAGNTEFQFHTAGLNFKSSSYDWLVISGGAKAQYKGSGTVNGVPGYSFMLTAIDGDQGGNGQDRFRIKITGPGGLVYDNQLNAPDTSDPTTLIGGGSIVVHK